MWPPSPCASMPGHERPHAVDHAPEVDAEHPLPVVERERPRPARSSTTPALLHTTWTAPNASIVASARRSTSSHRETSATTRRTSSTRRPAARPRPARAAPLDVGQDDPHALGREPLGHGQPDAAGGPGDDGDPPAQLLHGHAGERSGNSCCRLRYRRRGYREQALGLTFATRRTMADHDAPDTYDVVVLGTGAAGLTAAIAAARRRRSVGRVREGRPGRRHHAWSGGMVWIPNNPHMAEVGIDDSREEVAHLHHVAVARTARRRSWSRRTSTPARDGRLARGANAGAVPRSSRACPTTTRSSRAAKPGGGRSLECPLFPFDELGRVGRTGSRVAAPRRRNITMSETPLGKARPSGVRAEELERRAGARRARLRAGPGRARCCKGLPRPRHRAARPAPRPRADHRRTAGSSASLRRPRRRGRGRARAAASSSPPAASSGTPTSCARSSAGR